MLVADALDVVLAVSVAEHGRTFDRLGGGDLGAVPRFQVVAGGDRSGRAGRRDESRQPTARVCAFELREHAIEGGAGAVIMDQVVGEFGKLIDDHVALVTRKLGALVVDFLDVAFRSRRADDVGGIRDPFVEPIEALLAHAGGQHGHAAAAQDAGDGNAAAAVVSGGRPHGAIMRRIEMSGQQTRHQTGIGGQHLVRPDHGKAPPEQNDDRRLHAGQRLRQDDMAGQRHAILAVGGVEPVDAPQIFRIRVVRADRFEARSHAGRDARRIGELAPGR